MAKNVTVARANKRIRELQNESEAFRKQSQRGLIAGLMTLAIFAMVIVIERLLVGSGFFGENHMIADNVALVALMFDAFISMHFWRDYSKGNREYRECLYYIRQYEVKKEKSKL